MYGLRDEREQALEGRDSPQGLTCKGHEGLGGVFELALQLRRSASVGGNIFSGIVLLHMSLPLFFSS